MDGLGAGSPVMTRAPQHLLHHPKPGVCPPPPPLRRFCVLAVIQLQCAFNAIPVPSRKPPSTDTPLLESIRTDIDYNDLSDEDTTTTDSPADSTHGATGATTSLPPVAPMVDIPARRLTPANQSLRFLETGALGAARPDALPSRPDVPDLSIASSRLLSCIDPMPLDWLLCHTVGTINSACALEVEAHAPPPPPWIRHCT